MLSVTLWFVSLAAAPAFSPASGAPVTIKQLRTLAVEALRDGDVAYSPPWNKVAGRILWVKDAGPLSDRPGSAALDYWFDGGDPLKAVFLDQLAIEIRRQRLFAGTRRQLIIEPYYRRMEEVVAAELAIVQGPGEKEEKQRQLDERLRELGDLLKTGIEACARNMRLAGAFIEPGHDDGTVWLDRLFAVYLPRQGQLNYAQLQQGVAQAIREKAIGFEPPRISVNAGRLTVVDIALPAESPRPLARIEEVAAELAKLELRRRHPIPDPASRSIMDAVYAQMERSVRQRFDELRQAGAASADSIRQEVPTAPGEEPEPGEEPRSAFATALDDALKQGLERCARSMGNLRLDFSPGRRATAVPAQTVRLAAPAGTKVDFVHNTDRKLWSLAGQTEADFPWAQHRADDAVDLSGGYWFRLTYSDGRQLRLSKKVTGKETELRFPPR
ncbi:MAG TPA: hypothetical protein VG125_31295 [Pirellulales bacterium]|nr:hypothetical protein [Pirellulales bacterium]